MKSLKMQSRQTFGEPQAIPQANELQRLLGNMILSMVLLQRMGENEKSPALTYH
jgi:hypothetical protein